jgi:mono/diheme cytochrome c family protein
MLIALGYSATVGPDAVDAGSEGDAGLGKITRGAAGAAVAGLLAAAGPAGAFTAEQAQRGASQYNLQCGSCHGMQLEGREAPALRGTDTMQTYGTAEALYGYFSVAMPPTAPGRLGEETYLDIMAHILEVNGAAADDTALSTDALAAIDLAALTPPPAAAAAAEGAPDTDVPQAFTIGKPLPTLGADSAAGTEAAPASGIPQAFTFGKPLPKIN